MTQVTIIDTRGSKGACERALEMARAAGSESTTIISSETPAGLTASERHVALGGNLGSVLKATIRPNSQCVVVNAGVMEVTPNALPALTEMMRSSENEFRYEATRVDGSIVALGESTIDDLPRYLSSIPVVPTAMMSFPSSLISDESMDTIGSLGELTAMLFVQAMANGVEISQGSLPISSSQGTGSYISEQLSKDQAARALRCAVTVCNIEDLFPNHAWQQHGEESASASFHALAGMFIRLDDLDTASQCLNNSDRFEDSPRSLALQGLIAMRKGETLGAVAKMITSLQEYENRKRDTGSHYLSFNPSDFEGINANLTAGLAALNKRDNSEAAEHFSKAIFEFDPFYREIGLVITGSAN